MDEAADSCPLLGRKTLRKAGQQDGCTTSLADQFTVLLLELLRQNRFGEDPVDVRRNGFFLPVTILVSLHEQA